MTRELINLTVATLMMTVVIALFLNYLLFIPLPDVLTYGFVITLVTLMGHELAHRFTATDICNMEAEFTLTSFAIEITLISIFVLVILIYIKHITGWYTWFIPVVASPGAVFVQRMQSRCSDNTAIAGQTYNLIVGLIALFILKFIFAIDPPYVLNDTTSWSVTLTALIAYFSFALAFLNALPLRFNNLALDGWYALNIDPTDKVVKGLTVLCLSVSFVVLFLTGWWVVVVPAGGG